MKNCVFHTTERNVATGIFVIMAWTNLFGQEINGRYEGAISRKGSIQLINMNLVKEQGVLSGTYEIPELGLYDVPLKSASQNRETLVLTFYYGKFQCYIRDSGYEFVGKNESWNPEARIHLKKMRSKPKPYDKEEITFLSGRHQLSGMLYHPKTNTKEEIPYVILIHGSGSQDRYASYYISLGYQLAQNKIGVLLYDKRGTGISDGDLDETSIHDLAQDAVAAFNYLKNRTDIQISELGFLGTSQGGWIAPIAANQVNKCDFIVLNVAPAVDVFEQEFHRIEYSMRRDGFGSPAIDSAMLYTQHYFEHVRRNSTETKNSLAQSHKLIEDKSWKDYLSAYDELDFEWWRLNDYNPKHHLSSLTIRTLCLYAAHDAHVPPEENVTLMASYLDKAKVPHEIKTLKGVNHGMKTKQFLRNNTWEWPQGSWSWSFQPIEFMEEVIDFIKS